MRPRKETSSRTRKRREKQAKDILLDLQDKEPESIGQIVSNLIVSGNVGSEVREEIEAKYVKRINGEMRKCELSEQTPQDKKLFCAFYAQDCGEKIYGA